MKNNKHKLSNRRMLKRIYQRLITNNKSSLNKIESNNLKNSVMVVCNNMKGNVDVKVLNIESRESEILRVLSELDVTDRAKVLVYATRLKNKK